ncbi:PREDICTED: mitochondrial import inner membrane translocase subunit TIM22-3-like isoform X2 [Ipomoea nil]|uniref:mitochondrial import inner membrane translocase subunit TIM22-3-like isoform X2 n=1 Tax=Ipomoea nil TaxID=35883 RepID=UPI000900C880|nr:PREDICTED: mitochondrial import inner membrane translocase subunit TIM22-3-like isoform X2 [Ipomoea nil]
MSRLRLPKMERTSDSDPNQTAETNSDALNAAAPSSCSAASSLLCFAGNSAYGAIIGSFFGYGNGLIKKKGFKGSFVEARSSAKRYAVSYGVENLVHYQLNMLRGKDDVINAGVAGCCTGLALSFPGTPQALVQSCLTYGAFSFIFDGLYRKLAPAQESSSTNSDELREQINGEL